MSEWKMDKELILTFGKISDYISYYGLTSMPKEAKDKIYEIVKILEKVLEKVCKEND